MMNIQDKLFFISLMCINLMLVVSQEASTAQPEKPAQSEGNANTADVSKAAGATGGQATGQTGSAAGVTRGGTEATGGVARNSTGDATAGSGGAAAESGGTTIAGSKAGVDITGASEGVTGASGGVTGASGSVTEASESNNSTREVDDNGSNTSQEGIEETNELSSQGLSDETATDNCTEIIDGGVNASTTDEVLEIESTFSEDYTAESTMTEMQLSTNSFENDTEETITLITDREEASTHLDPSFTPAISEDESEKIVFSEATSIPPVTETDANLIEQTHTETETSMVRETESNLVSEAGSELMMDTEPTFIPETATEFSASTELHSDKTASTKETETSFYRTTNLPFTYPSSIISSIESTVTPEDKPTTSEVVSEVTDEGTDSKLILTTEKPYTFLSDDFVTHTDVEDETTESSILTTILYYKTSSAHKKKDRFPNYEDTIDPEEIADGSKTTTKKSIIFFPMPRLHESAEEVLIKGINFLREELVTHVLSDREMNEAIRAIHKPEMREMIMTLKAHPKYQTLNQLLIENDMGSLEYFDLLKLQQHLPNRSRIKPSFKRVYTHIMEYFRRKDTLRKLARAFAATDFYATLHQPALKLKIHELVREILQLRISEKIINVLHSHHLEAKSVITLILKIIGYIDH